MKNENGNGGTDGHVSPFQQQPAISLSAVDFGRDESWIRGLSPDDLISDSGNFYPYYYMNLLSILGGKAPVERIRSIAVDSTRAMLLNVREYLVSLSGLPELVRTREVEPNAEADRALIKLRGWDLALIRSLLERKKGLIFCSHHLGPFMSLPHELALMGFKVSLIIDDITYRESVPRLEFVKSKLERKDSAESETSDRAASPENIHLLNILNAQDKDSFISMLKALEKGECIFVYVDGNTGWDGIWGSSSKSAIDFLGFPIAVKNGIPRLAAASGAPILPLVTIRNEEGVGELVYGAPIVPQPGMSIEQKDQFVVQAMKSIYKLLEVHALNFVDQWSSSCFLHRWRIPPDSAGASAPAAFDVEQIDSLLNDGKSFKINESRIAGQKVQSDTILVDVQTLKIYKAPQDARDLFARLLREDGLGSSDISAINGGAEGRQKILTLLARLKNLDVIVSR